MTVARIIAITAMVCAAIGTTTQAEAAKRKTAEIIKLKGCAKLQWFCGPVMEDFAGNRYTFIPEGMVPPGVPLRVVGRPSGDIYVGLCTATRLQVLSVTLTGKTCEVSAR